MFCSLWWKLGVLDCLPGKCRSFPTCNFLLGNCACDPCTPSIAQYVGRPTCRSLRQKILRLDCDNTSMAFTRSCIIVSHRSLNGHLGVVASLSWFAVGMLNNQSLSNPINLIEQIILPLHVCARSKWDHSLIHSASVNLTLGFISPLMLIANGALMNRVNIISTAL